MAESSCRGEVAEPRQPLCEPFACDVLEILVEREPCRHAERRQMVLPFRNRDIAALGDEHRVSQRLRMILEHRGHLPGRLEEELIAGIPEALRIVDGLTRPDAQQDVVRLVIALLQVMHVVGADERQVEIARERQQPLVDDLLLLDALVLHL